LVKKRPKGIKKETTKISPSIPPTSFPCIVYKNPIVAKAATAEPAAKAAGVAAAACSKILGCGPSG